MKTKKKKSGGDASTSLLRLPMERRFAHELEALEAEEGPRPPGWRMSPRAVRTFIVGGEAGGVEVRKKYYGAPTLVDRCIVTLMSNRALLLVGEPGTAKTMLSELLSAAISGTSQNTVQGSAGTTEDHIKYSWNYAMLLAKGPSREALVPSPVYRGLEQGQLVRFEEVTRCPPEIQDALISVLSDKVIQVPELGDDASVYATRGFNVIATANLRDRGVHEMSSALKRRFNFEIVPPIASLELEVRLVREQTEELLRESEVEATLPEDVVGLLVTSFQELRSGKSGDGRPIDKPSTVMSTAEAVAVAFASALDAAWFGDGTLTPEHLVRHLRGTVSKDGDRDQEKVRQYFDVIVKARGKKDPLWKRLYAARDQLDE